MFNSCLQWVARARASWGRPLLRPMALGSAFVLAGCGAPDDPGPDGAVEEATAATASAIHSQQTRSYVPLATGTGHTCIVRPDSTVACAGGNDHGQIGDGTVGVDRLSFVTVPGLNHVVQLAAGDGHTCALLDDGTARCWGDNQFGQLGDNGTIERHSPVVVTGLTGATAIVASGGSSGDHTCALLAGGTVKCWGRNSFRQLGGPTNEDRSFPVPVPGIGGANVAARALAVGQNYSCALMEDGAVKCWGSLESGNISIPFGGTPAPVPWLGAPAPVVGIAAGPERFCVVKEDGSMACMGVAMLGTGYSGGAFSLLPVVGIGGAAVPAVSASTGPEATCAVLADGTADCWGLFWTYLGTGIQEAAFVPTPVVNLSRAARVSVGGGHSCAVRAGGGLTCWGYNPRGQFGNGTSINSFVPVDIPGVAVMTGEPQIAAGQNHACGLLPNGTVKCWGYNASGQLGNSTTTDSSTPVMVSGLTNAVAVAVGDQSSCAVLGDGTARCWGKNQYGQLGNGLTANSSVPVQVAGLTGAVSISAGASHACARLGNGSTRCWGNNAWGQCGDGTTASPKLSPVAVQGLSGAWGVDARGNHTCAVAGDGRVRCWGLNNFGQLGDGTTTSRSSATLVLGPHDVVQLASGYNHTCVLEADGGVQCWGDNTFGQHGNGTNQGSYLATPATTVSGATAITAGNNHTCVVVTGGGVKCFGRNSVGQLGDATTIDRWSATPVAGLSASVAALGAGDDQTCAVLSDMTARCWGGATRGELGNGLSGGSLSPVVVSSFP